MAATEPKSFTWRISCIPGGIARETLVSFFRIEDRDRVTIRSLYPDVSDPEWLTATVLFKPHPEQPDAQPALDLHAPHDLYIDRDFEGFTPLYSPPPGQPITAEYV